MRFVRHAFVIFVKPAKVSMRKKMTRINKIVSLTLNNENMLGIMYCIEHTKRSKNVAAIVEENQCIQTALYNLIMAIL